MRLSHALVCAFLVLNAALPAPAQQPPPVTSSQASVLLQRSLSALTGGHAITDVTLTASARRIAGSDDETGTGTLKAVATGASSVELTLPSGQRSEIMNTSATLPTGSWSGPDGTAHSMAYHNMLTGPFWFFPAFALAASSSGPGAVVTYIGHETHNDQAVEHLSITQSSPVGIITSDPSYPHLTQLDFFLDSTTFLPAALDFTIHPDHNELQDIPVEIRFAAYTAVNGTQVPFHIQKLINNSFALDLQIQNASLNAGITVAQISAH
jgi:hypothetical protein